MAYRSMANPDLYQRAIRGGGLSWYYTLRATRGGLPVAGATDLVPTGGSIVDTNRPGVRRKLSLEMAGGSALYDRLAPNGTRLTAACQVTYLATTVSIPMGVFDIDEQNMSEGEGKISLTAPDKWVAIQRAQFLRPQASLRSATVTSTIVSLIQGALGNAEPVNVTATSTERVGALTWEKDRAKAITDLATEIGAWVYFDRDGVATVADIPTLGGTADWLLDASSTGVLLDLDRQRSRTDTANIVVVESTHSEGAKFATQYCWDNDPGSPTFAGPGTGVGSAPPPASSAGPFGQVPDFLDTAVLLSTAAAQAAGKTRLTRVAGLASQVSSSSVPNPAADAFDVLDVLPPPERYDITRPTERHVADTLTHPLAIGSAAALRIEGRSIRAEEYAA